ncbi:hypothetical protein GM415_04610 [Pseudodesulfovibrio cashew]|uniref:Uncharacterized protein n=1 Tax=Pseudodesulfovibrio cashew TaxID=2678688 RepID=A0A6I6JBI5_9BACT|nr:hypothetical protein [Pseudodesulfovibrio cashew]QGY39431.1 hypothetical protein GM415_04610 [Pseudodesulfovibrio cashew]
MHLKYSYLILLLALLILAAPHAAGAASGTDFLSRMAEESEIKAIAVVAGVRQVSANSDGTFLQVTFKRVYALSPYTPKLFVGGCKRMDSGWQRRSPDMIYFKPKRGQKVFVTVTTDGGAITSYTPLNRQLDTVIREEPYRIIYSEGRAKVAPSDE